jgi:glyoxylase-like metal-dependent hydrolase (beta-lactamase superfamily II)
VDYIDLQFQGHERVIATAMLRGPDGITLIDPGPTSCLPALENGLARWGAALRDVRTILLTHIHLDHAGATGTITARVPGARVYVHERGAKHMVDPVKLISSATRLYGDRMDALWGRFDPVPADRLTPLAGGERLDLAGRAWQVAYTPGHAVHHVSYLDESSGVAYVGDTCGIRVTRDYIVAATPPPDINLPAWFASLDTIEQWRPASLFVTHFGPVLPAAAHLAQYREVLKWTEEAVRASLEAAETDEERAAVFVEQLRARTLGAVSEREAEGLEAAAPFDQIWAGMARYLRKSAPGGGLGDRPPSGAGGAPL